MNQTQKQLLSRSLVVPSVVAVCLALVAIGGMSGCVPGGDGDAGVVDNETDTLIAVKGLIETDLVKLHNASVAIEAAAPAPDADGWSRTSDSSDVAAMKLAWRDARDAYERIEGAIAVLFPDLDAATDERYDGFIADDVDDNLFDGDGVTGVHAIERILWSDQIPAPVVEFESALLGYVAARFPENAAEATSFKTELVKRLIDDTAVMRDDFAPLALDTPAAFRGVIGSMEEQLEKVHLAGTGEDESRYAAATLADMRANLVGGKRTFDAFTPWLNDVGEEELVASITARFDVIDEAYTAIAGDAIPEVPSTFDPLNPSDADLDTAYGRLFAVLSTECDPDDAASMVSLLNEAADALGIPTLP